MGAISYRKMMDSDWESVERIYEKGIETGIATFENSSANWEKWNQNHLDICRIVAVSADQVVAWVALSAVSHRAVYRGVAEVSIYVDSDFYRKGIGKNLMLRLIEESEKQGIWTLQSGIFAENKGSIELHKKTGFRIIGIREKIGMKNGVWKDNVIMERRSLIVG